MRPELRKTQESCHAPDPAPTVFCKPRLHSDGILPIWGTGGWWWTSHSPTGSGPEGSSPNEPRHGSSCQPPTPFRNSRRAIVGPVPMAKCVPKAKCADSPRRNGLRCYWILVRSRRGWWISRTGTERTFWYASTGSAESRHPQAGITRIQQHRRTGE